MSTRVGEHVTHIASDDTPKPGDAVYRLGYEQIKLEFQQLLALAEIHVKCVAKPAQPLARVELMPICDRP